MQNSSVSTTATATPYVSAPATKPVSPTTTPTGTVPAPATSLDGRDRLEISSLARKLDVLRRAEEGRKAQGIPAEKGADAHAPGQAADRTDLARTGSAERSRAIPEAAAAAASEEVDRSDSGHQQTELARLRRLREEAQARGEELSVFERERLGRLERIELLVQEGRYSIEPAMMDLLAIRLAKFMISPHA